MQVTIKVSTKQVNGGYFIYANYDVNDFPSKQELHSKFWNLATAMSDFKQMKGALHSTINVGMEIHDVLTRDVSRHEEFQINLDKLDETVLKATTKMSKYFAKMLGAENEELQKRIRKYPAVRNV